MLTLNVIDLTGFRPSSLSLGTNSYDYDSGLPSMPVSTPRAPTTAATTTARPISSTPSQSTPSRPLSLGDIKWFSDSAREIRLNGTNVYKIAVNETAEVSCISAKRCKHFGQ